MGLNMEDLKTLVELLGFLAILYGLYLTQRRLTATEAGQTQGSPGPARLTPIRAKEECPATTYSSYFLPLARYGPSGKYVPTTFQCFCSHSSKPDEYLGSVVIWFCSHSFKVEVARMPSQ